MLKSPLPREYSSGTTLTYSIPRFLKLALAAATMAAGTYAIQQKNGPSKKAVADGPGKSLDAMSVDERYVHDRITEHALVWSGVGEVAETHTTWVASNEPVEDKYKIAQLPQDRLYLGVYDGHAGWECSELLQSVFHNYIGRHFLAQPDKPTEALINAYDEMDADLIDLPSKVKALPKLSNSAIQKILMPAMAGAVVMYVKLTSDHFVQRE
jgi:hypothetical protein